MNWLELRQLTVGSTFQFLYQRDEMGEQAPIYKLVHKGVGRALIVREGDDERENVSFTTVTGKTASFTRPNAKSTPVSLGAQVFPLVVLSWDVKVEPDNIETAIDDEVAGSDDVAAL